MKKTAAFHFGSFELRLDEQVLLKQGRPVRLTPKAFDTLAVLVRHHGSVVTRDALMREVWPDTFVEDGGLTQNISVLRKLLNHPDQPELIETIPRRGYRFAGFVEEVRRAADDAIGTAPSDAPGHPRVGPAHDAAACTDYLEGRHHLAQRTIERVGRAIDKFERAVQRDGEYALAYAGLAEAYTLAASAEYGGVRWAESMARAKAAAIRALALDDGLAQAHASLALVHFRLDWNWALAESEFRRALALNPGDADLHHVFAFYLIAMERRDHACAEAEEAYRLQPVSLVIGTGLGRILHLAGQNERAIDQFARVRDLEPSFAQAHFDLSFVFAEQERLDEAIESCQKAIGLAPGRPVCSGVLGHYLARAGRLAEARATLGDLERMVGAGKASPFDLALVHTGFGDVERAIETLRLACRERHGLLVYLRVEPLWNRLRGDPRFGDLLREIGLVPHF